MRKHKGKHKGTHRIHLPLDTIEEAEKKGYIWINKPGHQWFEWKIGNRIVLNDHKFRFDRIQMRLTQIWRHLRERKDGTWKVISEILLEKM